MPVSGRSLTLQDLFSQLANNASESIPLDTSEVLNQLYDDEETLLLNVSGSPPTFVATVNYPVNVLGDYPTSYWRLAEAAAVGTAYDSNQGLFSVYPRIASSTMTAITQGASSFYATGVSAQLTNTATSVISFANNASLQITGDLTLELWLNVSSFGTGGTTYSLIGKGVTGSGSTGEYELYVTNSSGAGVINFRQNNSFTTLNATSNLAVSTWYHIAVTRVAATKTATIYINGVAAGSSTYSNTPTTTTGSVNIGVQGSYSTVLCSMTEAAFYHKALSATQVANHYAWGTASTAAATPYGGASATYGSFPYPAYGSPTTEAYGAAGTLWNTFVWK